MDGAYRQSGELYGMLRSRIPTGYLEFVEYHRGISQYTWRFSHLGERYSVAWGVTHSELVFHRHLDVMAEGVIESWRRKLSNLGIDTGAFFAVRETVGDTGSPNGD